MIPITPQFTQLEFEAYQTEGSATVLRPDSVYHLSIERLDIRLANGQIAPNCRRFSRALFEGERYIDTVQYNIVLGHPEGFQESDFYPYANRLDMIGRFFKALLPFYARCVKDPISTTKHGQTFRQSPDGKRKMKWRGFDGKFYPVDEKISDPATVRWSTYNLLWTRALESDERVMVACIRYGNFKLGIPTLGVASEAAVMQNESPTVVPTNPLELSLLERGGCCGGCP